MKSTSGSPLARGVGRVIGMVFLVPFFLFGGFMLMRGIRSLREGSSEAWAIVGFSLVFLLFSAGFLVLMFRGKRGSTRQEETSETPWLLNKKWANGLIAADGGIATIGMWVFAIFWNAVSSPLLFVFREEWEKGNKAILIGLLFPVVGIGLLVAAIRLTIRWKKFGRSMFRMTRVPGGLGGTLSGMIEVPAVITAKEGFKLRLSCTKRTTSGSGKNRTTQEKLLWEEKRVAPGEAVALVNRGTHVPVFFKLPSDQPESLEGNPAIVWKLEANADVEGIDYAESFSVPVFEVDKPPGEADADPLEAYQVLSTSAEAPEFRGIEIRDLLDGVQVHYRAARNPGAIFSLGVFTAIWSAALWFFIVKGVTLLFPIVWGLFGVILLVALVSSTFHSMRVVVTGGRLTVRHWLIVPVRKTVIDVSSVEGVAIAIGNRSGSKHLYRIDIKLADRKKISGGSGIPNKLQAQWLSERIAIALGL